VTGLELPRAVPCACLGWSPEGPRCGGRGQSGPCGHWHRVQGPRDCGDGLSQLSCGQHGMASSSPWAPVSAPAPPFLTQGAPGVDGTRGDVTWQRSLRVWRAKMAALTPQEMSFSIQITKTSQDFPLQTSQRTQPGDEQKGTFTGDGIR